MNSGLTQGFFDAVHDMVSGGNEEWWVEQFFIWLVFSVFTGLFAHLFRLLFEWFHRRQYKGWHLVLLGEDVSWQRQSLHWEEMQRILESEFEYWKLIGSIMSGVCNLTVTWIGPAEEAGWACCDRENKQLVIDFNKVPPEHLENGCWKRRPKNLREDAKCREECHSASGRG